MNRFTIFKAKNGWIVLQGDHDYVAHKDTEHAHVFTNVADLAKFLTAATRTE